MATVDRYPPDIPHPSKSSIPQAIQPIQSLQSLPLEENPSIPPSRHTLRVLSAFLVCFTAGWGDGVVGVVLPYINLQFKLSYTLSATLFVAVSSGYVITAFTMERTTNYFGRFPLVSRRRLFFPLVLPCKDVGFSHTQGRSFLMTMAAFLHVCFLLTAASSKTFPGVLAAFFMNGFAKGNMVSTLNAYMVANPHTFGLGHMHACFCLGALVSPLVAQTVLAHGWHWQQFYYASIALSSLNLFLVTFAFHCASIEFARDRESALRALGGGLRVVRRGEEAVVVDTTLRVEEVQASRHNLPRNMFMTALRTPAVLAFGFFVSMYTGSEGVTSGYIVTYLLKTRAADPSRVGYANSALWAGAAIGRLLLGYGAPYMGRLKPYWIFAFLLLAISFHISIWLVPSWTIGWGLTALVGLCMGPVFPLTLEIASRFVSPAITSSALAIMSSMGNLGGAFYPFLTGLLSNAKGEKVIEPLIVSLMSTMFCFWGATKVHFKLQ